MNQNTNPMNQNTNPMNLDAKNPDEQISRNFVAIFARMAFFSSRIFNGGLGTRSWARVGRFNVWNFVRGLCQFFGGFCCVLSKDLLIPQFHTSRPILPLNRHHVINAQHDPYYKATHVQILSGPNGWAGQTIRPLDPESLQKISRKNPRKFAESFQKVCRKFAESFQKVCRKFPESVAG